MDKERNIEGFAETARAFKFIGDYVKKVRRIKGIEGKVGQIYLKTVKEEAKRSLSDRGELAQSFVKRRVRDKGNFIDTQFSARGKGKWFINPAVASIFSSGTEQRQLKSGKSTGKIKATNFIENALMKTRRPMSIDFEKRMKEMIFKAVHGSRWKGKLSRS